MGGSGGREWQRWCGVPGVLSRSAPTVVVVLVPSAGSPLSRNSPLRIRPQVPTHTCPPAPSHLPQLFGVLELQRSQCCVPMLLCHVVCQAVRLQAGWVDAQAEASLQRAWTGELQCVGGRQPARCVAATAAVGAAVQQVLQRDTNPRWLTQ